MSTRENIRLIARTPFTLLHVLVFAAMNTWKMVFSKVHQACHDIANGIKQESNSKKTNKHVADCSKAVRKVALVPV